MAKFYVQSGCSQLVIQARDPRCAAIWAVHRTLSQTLPFLCDEPADYVQLADLTGLGDEIRVSQRGFHRADAAVFATLDIVREWNQLLVALDRLQARLEGGPQGARPGEHVGEREALSANLATGCQPPAGARGVPHRADSSAEISTRLWKTQIASRLLC